MNSLVQVLLVVLFFNLTTAFAFAGGGGGGGDRPVKVSMLITPKDPGDRRDGELARLESERRKFCLKDTSKCLPREDAPDGGRGAGYCGDVYDSFRFAAHTCPKSSLLIPNLRSLGQWTCFCYGSVSFSEKD